MQYIKDSIINYIKKENTNYAILLNGKWGSGKTYFWENEMKPIIESLEINEKKQINIYISLYGVSSLDEINKRIVLDKLITNKKVKDLTDSKWGGRITEFAKMGVGIAKSLEIPILKDVIDSSVNFENIIDLSNTVLCFDDLERANIDITDILGYINNFVEHDGAKVIIIGFEDEIAEKLTLRNLELKMLASAVILDKEGDYKISKGASPEQVSSSKLITDKMNSLFHNSNEYKRIKEKLIGKTLTLQPDYAQLISDIVVKVTTPDLNDFLEKNLENIINIFKDSQTDNIRILKQALDDFELIFSKYNEEYGELGDEILSSILYYTLAVSFEIKSDQEGNIDLEQATKDTLFLTSFSRKISNSDKESYIERFTKKYSLRTKNSGAIVFFPFVERLVRRGIFDLEQFGSEMQSIQENLGKTTPLYLRLLNEGFYYFTDEEFEQASSELYEKLTKGDLSFVLYLKAFNYYRYFIKKGLVQRDLNEVKKAFLEGLDIAADKCEYYPDISTYFIATNIEPEDTDLIEFKEKIFSINNKLKMKSEEKNIRELIAYMETDFNKFVHQMSERYFYIPVFYKYSVDDLCKKIISLSNVEINRFCMLLEKRYSYKEEIVKNKLYLDKQPLLELKSKIEKNIDENGMTLKVALLKDLVLTIDEINIILKEMEPKEINNQE